MFSGNWKQAWEGVKQIFSGVMDSLKAIVKAPINAIITAINTLIGGLSKIKIPDWVPGIGGKGINIPQIPMLAKGSRNSPDTFIAGEKGPELITNSKGRTVFTAMQTGKILNNASAAQSAQTGTAQQVIITLAPALMAALAAAQSKGGSGAGQAQNAAAAQQVVVTLAPALTAAMAAAPALNTVHSPAATPQVQAPTLQAAPAQGGTVLKFTSAPVFNVSGGDPEEMREMFEEYHDKTMQDVEQMINQKEDDERRGRYE